ncbi:hypothetical protein GA0061071_11369 [Kosakonia oryzendophytica]|uniref:ASCH domain-containing protein n=1 Tax=Kosakonia oryzendophytica TaxID=1005665 RepID=A0A1C4DN12_9ENTR|nr:hypothetical protein [Kosakonia oryzendophytica]SCC32756.1 hypothetical protein GA0061071_11369 [Kosakonia oryzendophytica]
MKYQALSIMKPAVENIINGSKINEIRSWVPNSFPLYNVLIVQNNNYLRNDDDVDEGIAMALVDFTSVSPWTHDIFLKQNNQTTLDKKWKPGYFLWRIENVRPLSKAIPCEARKGVYILDLDIIS